MAGSRQQRGCPGRATQANRGLTVMDTRDHPPREPKTLSAAQELTATLWCVAALLAVLLLAYWFVGQVYSA
jgi:hypothetical protein